MLNNSLVLGIDLGTSGVRIAIIDIKKNILFTSSETYLKGLNTSEDWVNNIKALIKKIPKDLKEKLVGCSVAGTSGTLLACKKNGEPIGEALPYFLSCEEYKKNIENLFTKESVASSTSGSVARALRLLELYGIEILLRHQADWISGWLINNWEYGEEGNNI